MKRGHFLVALLIAFQVQANEPKPTQGTENSTPLVNSKPVGSVLESEALTPRRSKADILGMRDPFRRPQIVLEDILPKSELERFAVSEFKMVGLITGPDQLKAMLLGPDGKTYFVRKDDRIGSRGGFVQEINSVGIVVEEEITNVVGEKEKIVTEITLPPETDNQFELTNKPSGRVEATGLPKR